MRWIHGSVWALFMGCMLLTSNAAVAEPLRAELDAPLLFVKRHSYDGIHIYDTYYKWKPGGGIYVLENPGDDPAQHRVRPVIDATTPETLGAGIYSDPDLSWDATCVLFCFKGSENGSTGIYEINIDGTGLRTVTQPLGCAEPAGRFTSHHDVGPAYLPDGRIVFTTTRPNGLVPCNNTGVDILHMMDADGGSLRRISVNNVNEFDPCIMPDGRILHGRWEYVDKTALTQQSLWTIFPDGTFETAVYANNLVRPEALLDARPVPGAPHLIAATLARHNAPPRGSIAIVDTRVSKNDPVAIINFEHPAVPTVDTGDSCEPWPLSEDLVLFSGRPAGSARNVIELIARDGRREVVYADADICCHSPIPVKPRALPHAVPEVATEEPRAGSFFVQDIYQGLTGVEPGTVKWLRLIEETSRVTGSPGGGSTFNQTFLLSAALAFSAKNYLGVVPVEEDGSAYFEAPPGRALYLQALDEHGRLVQSMRTFVQAAPGTTRSCIGCHEHKYSAPVNKGLRAAFGREPVQPRPESWGSGYLDYPSMVQPVLDTHCLPCHGGEKGFAGGLDLSGGWTEFFNISYENLVSRRESQMTASLIAGIDCMNGTALWSAQILPPRAHGSGCAPLADVLVSGHGGRIPELTRRERDLLLAWIDSNGLYYGSWDYTENSSQLAAWTETKDALLAEMDRAGCMACHQDQGTVQFENDWFNLREPEFSRILRAPLARDSEGMGLALCREKKTNPARKRIRLLVGGGYAHGVEPLEHYQKQGVQPAADVTPAAPKATFTSTSDLHYQAMLAAIRKGRRDVLAAPRVDVPGADIIAGQARQFVPPAIPAPLPALHAAVGREGLVHLSWERSARTIGLAAEVHAGDAPDFVPAKDTRIAETPGFTHVVKDAAPGQNHYALILSSGAERSAPIRVAVTVPEVAPPPAPAGLDVRPGINQVALQWDEESDTPLRYHVYRAGQADPEFIRITDVPTPRLAYRDVAVAPETSYRYTVRSVNRRGLESAPVAAVSVMVPASVREPVFSVGFDESLRATLYGGETMPGTLHGNARLRAGVLDLRRGGHATFENRPELTLSTGFTVECVVRLDRDDGMPVVVSCGAWGGPGWFLQRLGPGWRWHVGGISCDGGAPVTRAWTHLAGTYDGEVARLYQDGALVAQVQGQASTAVWGGPLFLGQYGAAPGAPYQVDGRIGPVRIYTRALAETELMTLAANRERTARLTATAESR